MQDFNHINTTQFIALEGLEGAGKSSAIQIIKAWFEQNKTNDSYLFTREPGGTFLAEKIRKLLISDYQEESLTEEAELLLMYASRMQHVKKLIMPALEDKKWVISDRFFWSSFAYQGGGRSIGLNRTKQIHQALLSHFQPGLTILLDLDPVIGLKRIQSRETDRIENEKLSFFERAREIYLTLAQEAQSACVIIDASKPLNEVQGNIIEALENYIHANT
ncbi:dTMP kinase [Thiotrichales bacterium 19S11-10]|nr:dTMP kinase [Thiotrichales bacterium 19S11-10]